MKIMKITESKKEKMADYAEKMLRYGGKLMQCLEELDEGNMGERDGEYPDDDWDDDEMMGYRNGGGGMGQRRYRRESGGMGERRSRLTGRFIR